MVYTLAPIVIGVTVVVEPKPPPPVEVVVLVLPPLVGVPKLPPPDVVPTLAMYVSETQPSTPETKSTFHQ